MNLKFNLYQRFYVKYRIRIGTHPLYVFGLYSISRSLFRVVKKAFKI